MMNSTQSASPDTVKALFVGGCIHNFHFLEPTIPAIRALFSSIDIEVDVAGIYHPKRFPADAPAGVNAEETELTGDYSALNAENLSKYQMIALFTTGNGNGENVPALLDFVRKGGALVGFHCAADSFQNDDDYVAAIGGLFRTHPAPLDIKVEFVDTEHPITQGLESFTVKDELYLFQKYDPSRVHLLAETRSYKDDPEQGETPIPICWTRTEGDGRIFYVSLGHFPEVMADANWQELVRRGATWALQK